MDQYSSFLQTSNTSTFLLHEVAKNADLQDKLYKEVTSIVSSDQLPTFEDIQKMQLVRGCAKETLRYILNVGRMNFLLSVLEMIV